MSQRSTEVNIQSIYEREKAEHDAAPISQKIADRIAFFSGTVLFILIHVFLFAGWIVLNQLWLKLDPYPFTFLTMVVSLESIFLASFVMLSQNALSTEEDRRSKLDLQINLLTEQELTAMLILMDKIAEKLGIEQEHRELVQALAEDVDAGAVLDQIKEIEKTDR